MSLYSLYFNKPLGYVIPILNFFVGDNIQKHKALSSYMAFFIKSFSIWTTFLDTFPRYVLGRKVFVYAWQNDFLKIFPHLKSRVAPCCIFVICNMSSTILEYLGACLRWMYVPGWEAFVCAWENDFLESFPFPL